MVPCINPHDDQFYTATFKLVIENDLQIIATDFTLIRISMI